MPFKRPAASQTPHLGFGVRPQPRQRPVAAQLGHFSIQLVRQDDGQGHTLFRLVSGVAKHQTLRTTKHVSEQKASP